MVSDRDPLSPFDDEVLDNAAADANVEPEELRALVRRHQEFARSFPGVKDLIYEWRRFLPYDPLVARTDDAYHLVVLSSVWAEFGEQMDLSTADLDRLERVHDRQARRAATARGDSTEVFDEASPIVLTRE